MIERVLQECHKRQKPGVSTIVATDDERVYSAVKTLEVLL